MYKIVSVTLKPNENISRPQSIDLILICSLCKFILHYYLFRCCCIKKKIIFLFLIKNFHYFYYAFLFTDNLNCHGITLYSYTACWEVRYGRVIHAESIYIYSKWTIWHSNFPSIYLLLIESIIIFLIILIFYAIL